ncbi:hypothetical protein [Xenorhabdus bovienii]|uniref:hypothetical protein n=1 Tax=Xenorhabdus bovienii TaxID=40576 RepID=UPI003DA2E951
MHIGHQLHTVKSGNIRWGKGQLFVGFTGKPGHQRQLVEFTDVDRKTAQQGITGM